ncbi:MAG: proline dehydrogenase family protein [Candidatus Krumholzibacteria bacterium]|nr:proline dehydrogenase family protein [Candidatus Krumholzibacteria bacterium]MDP6797554.1 proline dehydrogenase family protein [Candidatus Krumholzibacteria bacterium]MDP7021229.1 proline dehydrogenase family protein [Candidatus Krumholzibacteria bacterium]
MPSFLDHTIAALLPLLPRPLIRRFSARYIAGDCLDDAASLAAELSTESVRSTMDILGEDVTLPEQAEHYTREYLTLLEEQSRLGLDRNVSIKLSMLGLKIDPELCLSNMRKIMDKAACLDSKIRIDMEDSSCTDDTLDLFRTLHGEYGKVGVVIQAYLYRSMTDIEALSDLSPDFRICKGIYVESHEVALQDADEIRKSFLQLLERMWELGSYVGIATHDGELIDQCLQLIREKEIGRDRYEFQMLLGVQKHLKDRLIREKQPLRIYIPFGADWYAYSIRRLKENPAIAGQVFRSLFR